MAATAPFTALALDRTPTTVPAGSSTRLMTDQVPAAPDGHGVSGSSVRGVDLDLKPGVDDVGLSVPARGGVYRNGEA